MHSTSLSLSLSRKEYGEKQGPNLYTTTLLTYMNHGKKNRPTHLYNFVGKTCF